MSHNLTTIEGVLETIEDLRFTPAGLPVLSFEVKHRSEQEEAGQTRTIEVILPVLAIGPLAQDIKKLSLGSRLSVKGFLAHRNMKSRSVVLHATAFRQEMESR